MRKILKKLFRGYVVLEEVNSPINGRIQVWEDLFGKRRLVVGGVSQSGEAVEKIWQSAIRQYKNLAFGKNLVSRFAQNSNLAIKKCLILGLGAGSAVRVVSRFFPGVNILGIEIDPEIIKLGRKYFELGRIPELEILTADAIPLIHKSSFINHKFDLILVDLYLGDSVPQKAEENDFLQNVNRAVSPSGIAIFNRLYYGKKKEKTDKFGEILQKFFAKIKAKKVLTNKLFLCQK